MSDNFWQKLRDAQDTTREQSDNVHVVRDRMPSRPPTAAAKHRWFAIAAGLAVAAAFALAIGSWQSRRTALSFEVGDEKELGKVGTWIAAPDGAGLPVRFFDGSSIMVAARSRARVTSLEATGAHVLLERGQVVVSVVHREKTRWEIAAGPFQVAVVGTRFTVSWDPEREVFRLQLHEGHVLVSGALLRDAQPLSQGQELRAFCKEQRLEIVGLKDDAALPAVAAPNALSHTGGLPDAFEPGQLEGSPRAREQPSSRPADPPRSSWLELAAAGKFAEAVESAERTGFEAECRRTSGRDLLTLGDAARLAKKPSRARQAYLAARDKLPGGGRASYGLGLVAFDQQRDLAEAAKWFEVYVAHQANGGLRSEALGRLIEAYQRMGNVEKARRVAVQYLLEYPTGAHAALARQLVSR